MPITKHKSKPKKRLVAIVASVLSLTIAASAVYFGLGQGKLNNQVSKKLQEMASDNALTAKASPIVEMSPGETKTFFISYKDTNPFEPSRVENIFETTIFTGSNVDLISIYDIQDTNKNGVYDIGVDPMYRICDTFATRVVSGGQTATRISYIPKSANIASTSGSTTVCSGKGGSLYDSNTYRARSATMSEADKAYTDYSTGATGGFFRYELRLKPDVVSSGRNSIGDEIYGYKARIVVYKPDATHTSTDDQDIIIKEPIKDVITLANIGSGRCYEPAFPTRTEIIIPNNTTCEFPLTGGTPGAAGYSIPPTLNVKLDNSSSSAPATNCRIQATGGMYTLICENVPTTNANPGTQPINVTIDGTTQPKGTVELRTLVDSNTVINIACVNNPEIVGTPVNCTVNLSGEGPFYIPNDYQIKIGDASPTLCSVRGATLNSNNFTCFGVATTGNTVTDPKGEPKDVKHSPDAYAVKEGTTVLKPVTSPVMNSNITSANCTPNEVYLDGTVRSVTCTAQLNASNLTGSIEFKASSGASTVGSCLAPVTVGSNSTSCVMTPTVIGDNHPISAIASGSPTSSTPVGTVTVYSLGQAAKSDNTAISVSNRLIGEIGSPMPAIRLLSANVNYSHQVTFTPQGCTTGIIGKVTGDTQFVPDSGSVVIPNCATTGPAIGKLTSPNYKDVEVFTDFSPKLNMGIAISSLTGRVGQQFDLPGTVSLINVNIPSGEEVRLSLNGIGTCTSSNYISGTIVALTTGSGTWIPNPGYTIPSCAQPRTTMVDLYLASRPEVKTPVQVNIVPGLTFGVEGFVGGVKGYEMPSIALVGANIPTGTSTTLTLTSGTCSSPISGTVSVVPAGFLSRFVPTPGTLIPSCALAGDGTATISATIAGTPVTGDIKTKFEDPRFQYVEEFTGLVGQPVPTFSLINSNLKNGTRAEYIPQGCTSTNKILGTIVDSLATGSSFRPDLGSNFPECTNPLVPTKNNGTLSANIGGIIPITTPAVGLIDKSVKPVTEDPVLALESFVCNPDSAAVNETIACVGRLKPEYKYGGIPFVVKVDNTNTNEITCAFSNDRDFTCMGLKVGDTLGNKFVQMALKGKGYTNTPEMVNVTGMNIDPSNFAKAIDWECNPPTYDNKAISAQTNYECIGKIKPGYIYPGDGKILIGIGINPTAPCSKVGTTPEGEDIIRCTNVPVMTVSGLDPVTTNLQGIINGIGPVNSEKTIEVSPVPTLGKTITTPIVGIRGVDKMPNINLIDSTMPENSVVRFTPQGCSVTILGKVQIDPITRQRFVSPIAETVIPECATVGPATGKLEAQDNPSILPLNVPTNFTQKNTLGSIDPSSNLTGEIGGNVAGSIKLIGSNIPDGTPATYTNGSCVIQGTITGGVFTPNMGQKVGNTCPVGINGGGTISVTLPGVPSVNGAYSKFTQTVFDEIIDEPFTYNQLTFTPDPKSGTVYGEKDLIINVKNMGFAPAECTIGVSTTLVPLATTLTSDGCTATIPASATKTENKLYFDIMVRNGANNKRYGTNVMYSFAYGSIPIITVIET